MKKIYYFFTALVFIIFFYYILTSLPIFFNKMSIITTTTLDSASFSTSKPANFKATSEKKDILQAYLNVNNSFLASSPLPKISNKKTIKNFSRLQIFFPNYNSYYVLKDKVDQICFVKLKNLLNETKTLSIEELTNYFAKNKDYLIENFGITSLADLQEIISSLKNFNSDKIKSFELENSYFYIDELDILTFRILITLEDNSKLYLCANSNLYDSNNYQTAPTLSIYSALGGTSYV